MGDPLWSTAWRYALGALVLAAAGAAGLTAAGRPTDALGLLAGAVLSSSNFLATSLFMHEMRSAARQGRDPIAAGHRSAAGFILRYLLLGGILLLLVLVAGLPPVTTVLGLAAVPLTIYLWQMGRLVTGRWRG
ncbi:MAG: ATP synthase subunit I [bacterium]